MKNQLLQYKPIRNILPGEGILVGNRLPRHFFETSGTGESDIAVHAGSYHLALKDAGIEMYNIMTYSSILPGIAEKINPPEKHDHGAVLESIVSVCHAERRERATAGIIYGWLFNKKTRQKYGGLVCEHAGNYNMDELRYRLGASLEELYSNGFEKEYYLDHIEILSKSFIPEKKFGTALVALCFTSYFYPFLKG